MADYAKLGINLQYSTSSDYSNDQINSTVFGEHETRPDSLLMQTVFLSASGSEDIELGSFDTVHYVVIENLSDDYACDVAWTSDTRAQDPEIPANGFIVIPNPTPANDLTVTATSSGAVKLRVVIYGVLTAL